MPQEPGEYLSHQARLHWRFEPGEGALLVTALNDVELMQVVRHSGGFLMSAHRWPSQATPALHVTGSVEIRSEDDILHIPTLPDFGGVLSQRDSEQLLSYLVVPYMRIPLVLNFFATQDRIHALRSERLREIVASVVFEPGRYLPFNLSATEQMPPEVPTKDPRLLGTAHGLLLNEVQYSADHLVDVVTRLLQQALDMDTGNAFSATRPIALFLIRLAVHVEKALRYLYTTSIKARGLSVGETARAAIARGLQQLGTLLRGAHAAGPTDGSSFAPSCAQRMIESWLSQVQRRLPQGSVAGDGGGSSDGSKGSGGNAGESSGSASAEQLDVYTRLACNLHAHLLLVVGNCDSAQLTAGQVTSLLGSFIYLSIKHTWNNSYLSVPESQLFYLMHNWRPKLVAFMEQARGPSAPLERRQELLNILQVGVSALQTLSSLLLSVSGSNRTNQSLSFSLFFIFFWFQSPRSLTRMSIALVSARRWWRLLILAVPFACLAGALSTAHAITDGMDMCWQRLGRGVYTEKTTRGFPLCLPVLTCPLSFSQRADLRQLGI